VLTDGTGQAFRSARSGTLRRSTQTRADLPPCDQSCETDRIGSRLVALGLLAEHGPKHGHQLCREAEARHVESSARRALREVTRWVSGCSSAALMTPTSCSQQWGASARQGRLPSTPSWPTRHRAQGVLSAAGRAVFRRAELCLRAELAWHEACPAVLGGAATGEAGTGRNKQ
jgi:hypothetical protein